MSGRLTVHNDNKPIYDIVIENDFKGLSDEVACLNFTDRKLCIVTDSNVGREYSEVIKKELEKTGNQLYLFSFEAGEENKNLDIVSELYEFLIRNRFDRKDMLAALGGGVVGDLTGFTAATYLRGIQFIQIPTSLLAQVDSSIGGKTGVDFKSYKNMVGAFHQPKLVYINTSTLTSLNTRLFNSGLGEIIKHGLIKDKVYYNWLKENTLKIRSLDSNILEEMIYKSCDIKRNVVELDPKEQGDRALLNFGHTLGHAIEKLMNFQLYHGECVALGMIAALEISRKRHYITNTEFEEAVNMLKLYEFPLTVRNILKEDIIAVSKNDKKMDAGNIKFILLGSIGNAFIDKTVTDDEMSDALDVILSQN